MAYEMKRAGETVVVSFSIEKIVAEKLKAHCQRSKTKTSTFVNSLLKTATMDNIEYAREMAKLHAAEAYKWKAEADHQQKIKELDSKEGGKK